MSNKKFKKGVFVFRQDLRTSDNHGLRHASQVCETLILIFIVDRTILDDFPQDDQRLHFLYSALYGLDKRLKQLGSQLYILKGVSTEILSAIIAQESIDYLGWNRSYGTNVITRDRTIKKLLEKNDQVTLKETVDYLLVEPEKIIPMKVFTPFYHRWQAEKKVVKSFDIDRLPPSRALGSQQYEMIDPQSFNNTNHPYRPVKDGKFFATQLPLPEYDQTRNFPSQDAGTARLSPYLSFGLVSPRQILRSVIDEETPGTTFEDETVVMDKKIFKNSFVSELARREFWQHIAYHFPESTHNAFLEKYRQIERSNNVERFEARKSGNTGYPIVDAAMRQLLTENRMHGRCRMIVASFLTKDLHIDRKRGEEHFKNYLLDYDRNINIGNRQRSASVGADPKPLRIFNPILQSKKFDPMAKYIMHWIPELNNQPIAAIHDPITYKLDYTPPVVDHYEMSKKAKLLYAESREQVNN